MKTYTQRGQSRQSAISKACLCQVFLFLIEEVAWSQSSGSIVRMFPVVLRYSVHRNEIILKDRLLLMLFIYFNARAFPASLLSICIQTRAEWLPDSREHGCGCASPIPIASSSIFQSCKQKSLDMISPPLYLANLGDQVLRHGGINQASATSKSSTLTTSVALMVRSDEIYTSYSAQFKAKGMIEAPGGFSIGGPWSCPSRPLVFHASFCCGRKDLNKEFLSKEKLYIPLIRILFPCFWFTKRSLSFVTLVLWGCVCARENS